MHVQSLEQVKVVKYWLIQELSLELRIPVEIHGNFYYIHKSKATMGQDQITAKL